MATQAIEAFGLSHLFAEFQATGVDPLEVAADALAKIKACRPPGAAVVFAEPLAAGPEVKEGPSAQMLRFERMIRKIPPEEGMPDSEGYVLNEDSEVMENAPIDALPPAPLEGRPSTQQKDRSAPNQDKLVPITTTADKGAAVNVIAPADRKALTSERRKEFNKLGSRMLQTLAELELANGEIISNNLALAMRQLTEEKVAPDSFNKAFASLVKKGYALMISSTTEECMALCLTPAGKEAIADLKAYPELLDKVAIAPTKLNYGTTYKVLELMAERTEDRSGVWAYARHREVPVIPELAVNLGISEDALRRRLYEAREVNEYLEIEYHDGEIVNVQLTAQGLACLEYARRGLRQREKLLDEVAVEELDLMTQTCYELAGALGEARLLEELKQQRDQKHLFEFTPEEFKAEQKRIVRLLDRLRKDYAFEFSHV